MPEVLASTFVLAVCDLAASARFYREKLGFAELSKTNQVLVFTCHESMRDLFLQVAPMTQVIEIGG